MSKKGVTTMTIKFESIDNNEYNEFKDVMLSTSDNPFNPYTDYESWYQYDVQVGHNTCAYLARVAETAEDLPEELNNQTVYEAMLEIVKYNINGLYILVENPGF